MVLCPKLDMTGKALTAMEARHMMGLNMQLVYLTSSCLAFDWVGENPGWGSCVFARGCWGVLGTKLKIHLVA